MIKNQLKIGLMSLLLLGLTISCEKSEEVSTMEPVNSNSNSSSKIQLEDLSLSDQSKGALPETSENLGDLFRNAVTPSECGPTELAQVQSKYINAIIEDPLALAYNRLYSNLNLYFSYFLDDSEQYFGENGDYTQLMQKRQRELAEFWSMPVTIKVQGQHTANLDNRDNVAAVFYNFYGYRTEDGELIPLTIDQAYQQADLIMSLNEASPNLPENPYFATDGFASSNRTIVIGDGLPSWLAETGIDEGIVWTGILAHEWAHEIQFLNNSEWYPAGAADNAPEATRYTELEADFFASYFMTHKRGATYNWKRVIDFYDLFFQIGDCSFTNQGHHGTPLQRMAAARAGYELASEMQKQGHILTMDEVHNAYLAAFDHIVQ